VSKTIYLMLANVVTPIDGTEHELFINKMSEI
jgi:hypothetical protein